MSVTLRPEGEATQVVAVLDYVLVAYKDPGAVLRAISDPVVRIESLTVTKKGDCHAPTSGVLSPAHPNIILDLADDLPCSAPGYIMRTMQVRGMMEHAPFTLLTSDNVPENGKLVRGVVVDLARRIDLALANWIAEQGRFSAKMVDRISPATTQNDIARVASLTGRHNAAPVPHKEFRQWTIKDDFVGGARLAFGPSSRPR